MSQCRHEGETSTYCTKCWTNLYEARQRGEVTPAPLTAQDGRGQETRGDKTAEGSSIHSAPTRLSEMSVSGLAARGNLKMKDLKPLIGRNETNGLSQAEGVRDRIYDLFEQAAAKKQVDVLILKSPPFTSPPWVRVECWIPHPKDLALTLRSSAQLTVRPQEFHRFPIEIDMVISNDKRSRTWRSLVAFDQSHADAVLEYILYERQSHKFGLRRCRVWPFELWLPRNKPARLGIDGGAIACQALLLVGLVTVQYGFGIILLLIGAVMAYSNHKRRRHILSAGKPAQEPRKLLRLDSWQTLVRDVGSERDAINSAIRKELAQVAETGFAMAAERIWYWGVDGKEEREQLVLRFRRAMAFVHTYSYGNDLFVGWDAHVNCGTWVERVSGGGYDKSTQELCAVHTIAAGWNVPSEYDITDANCLLERVHAAVTKVVKVKLAEHHIDQEIDFKIFREQRQNIAGRQASDGGAGTAGIQGALSRFRRVG